MGEHQESIDQHLSQQNESDIEDVQELLRSMHSIKGGSEFFGLENIEALAHGMEDLLGSVRDGDLEFSDDLRKLLLKGNDRLRKMIDAPNLGEEEDIQGFLDELKSFTEADLSQQGAAPEKVEQAEPAHVVETPERQTPVEAKVVKAPVKSVAPRTESSGSETIRIRMDLLNQLMDLTGEIVLARNQLPRQFSGGDHRNEAVDSIAHMISDLQQVVMQTRMRPISGSFTKFRRIVRELASASGKEVQLKIEGEDTEMDRNILETLSDPLTHMVRNGIDHGMERPEERKEVGKDRQGTLSLSAIQEGGQVVVVVEDDGRGIDLLPLKEKALKKGIINASQSKSMTDQEALNLIFQPGFSTKEEITKLSGRGVGMDVVRSTLEKVGGVIEVDSKLGKGTKFTMYLPTTLAIVSSLIIRASGHRFVVPQTDIREVIVIREEDDEQIDTLQGVEVFKLRGELLPVVRQRKIWETSQDPHSSAAPEASHAHEEDTILLILSSGAHQFGLVIDKIEHTEEIVVKPLAKILSDLIYYSGSAVLGDGEMALVLSARGLCESANLKFQETSTMALDATAPGNTAMQEKQNMLVFGVHPMEQVALPLSLVLKVEQFSPADIQPLAEQRYVNLEGRN